MNDQAPNNINQPEKKTWREERWERRQARRAATGGSDRSVALIAGLLMVILGVVYLLQNYGNFSTSLKNWGALFLLIPVFALFSRAYRIYRDNGNQLTAPARGAGFVGGILLIVTVVTLFNLDWAIWGPLLIILVGIGLLLSIVLVNGKG